ncbi:histamine H3 receptor-like [Dendropsophus ebraccatus]|uniref:histamine H3 receptor-like n=1 Tax=Dendropsophus ebraccatus TaxID=150705 RepID=UPI0038319003
MTNLLVYNESGLDVFNLNETSDLDPEFSESVKIVIMLLISLLIIVTVFGNILVVIAFIVDKSLRTQSNFFLLNLAICDFIIGAFVIPLYLLYLLNGKWMLGKNICKLWVMADYTMCSASAFNIALISYDRFLSVTKAVLYRSSQNNHSQTVLKMASVWITSFLLYGPAILFWETVFGEKDVAEGVCVPAFYDAWFFHLGTSTFDFIFPLISISFFNLRIYWNITKRSKKRQQLAPPPSAVIENHAKQYTISTTLALSPDQMISLPLTKTVKKALRQCFQTKDPSQMDHVSNTYNIQVIKLSRDKKVAKSLAILVCIFAICWAPYTFLISIRTACHGYCIPYYWFDIAVWISYLNSAINPVLYPLCHKGFRKAFAMIFQKVF